MSEHTQGPWSAVTQTHDVRGNELDFPETVVQISQIPGGVVARMTMQVEREANARLIASAPDLLKSGAAVLHAIDHHSGDATSALQTAEAIECLRAAIARATGA